MLQGEQWEGVGEEGKASGWARGWAIVPKTEPVSCTQEQESTRVKDRHVFRDLIRLCCHPFGSWKMIQLEQGRGTTTESISKKAIGWYKIQCAGGACHMIFSASHCGNYIICMEQHGAMTLEIRTTRIIVVSKCIKIGNQRVSQHFVF